jgi:hypothetical protein
MKRTRWRPMIACLAVIGAAIAVAGGSAGNRGGTGTLVPQPGPGAVTYGENIAYKATFTNDSGSVFTQTKYVMPPPVAPGGETATPVAASCGTFDSNGVLTCDFGQLRPLETKSLTVVWKTPSGASKPGCKVDLQVDPVVECLKADGIWLIKEGKPTNGNESFPVSALASLIGVSSDDPVNAKQTAGGFELEGCSSTNPTSLSTDQAVDATTNPVTTSYCLPASFTASAADGVASTITEPASDSPNFAHQSQVCIAEPRTNCGDSTYKPAEFPDFITFTFRVADAALQTPGQPKYTITQVFHNSPTALPTCDAPGGLSNPDGCVVSIDPPKGPGLKTWKIVTKAKTNGPWSW